MHIEKLTSQIFNDILSGLQGYHQNISLNKDQLADEIVALRLAIIQKYVLQGVFPIKDLVSAINCVEVDCKSIERCTCTIDECAEQIQHFEIPQIITFFGKEAIQFIGTTDRRLQFDIVDSLTEYNNRKYRKRGKSKPFIWLDYVPNSSGMLDVFVFNAPLLKQVSIVAAFKDPRHLERFLCCEEDQDNLTGLDDNLTFIDEEVRKQLVAEKIQYYRQYAAPILPNDQRYVTGGKA